MTLPTAVAVLVWECPECEGQWGSTGPTVTCPECGITYHLETGL